MQMEPGCCPTEIQICVSQAVKKERPTTAPKHNSNVDILRIIACLYVITIHIMSADIVDNVIDKQAILIHVIVADAVAIFFSITGFLAFRSQFQFGKALVKFIKKTAVPTIAVGLVSQVFYKWIMSSSWCFMEDSLSWPDIAAILNGIIQHTPKLWNNLCHIYWYVFDYAFILLWFPVIAAVIKSKNGNKVLLSVVLWMFATLMVKDLLLVLRSKGINYSVYTYLPVSVQLTFICMGYLLYCMINRITTKIPLTLCILLYSGLVALRYHLQLDLYGWDTSKQTFVRYDGALSLISVFALYLIIWKIKIRSQVAARVLQWVANHTFHIYLIHYMIVQKLQKTHVLDKIRELVIDRVPQGATAVYDLIVVVLVFSIALLFAAVIQGCAKNVSAWIKRNVLTRLDNSSTGIGEVMSR